MIHLLVVDDERSIRTLLTKVLVRKGYQVSAASCGPEAFDILAGEDIDLIILDVIMEDIDGYTLCRQIKDIETYHDIPVIFLTAQEGRSALMNAYECGAVDFVEKPVDAGSLLMRLKSHIAHVNSKKEIREQHEKLKTYQALLVQEEKTSAVMKMVGGLSHEMNNPLACIKSNFQSLNKYLSLLQEDFESLKSKHPDEDEFLRIKKTLARGFDVLEECGEEFEQLYGITSRLMNLDLPADEEQAYSINEALHTACVLQGEALSLIEVSEDLCDDEVKVVCHPASLSQCFCSILDNAILAVKGNVSIAKISLISELKNGEVIVKIADNGCGMDEATCGKVFDPFFTTRAVGEGAGLGLSSIYSIIQQLHGSVEVESQLQQGSIFTIKLCAV